MNDLYKDISNGTTLIALIELLTTKKLVWDISLSLSLFVCGGGGGVCGCVVCWGGCACECERAGARVCVRVQLWNCACKNLFMWCCLRILICLHYCKNLCVNTYNYFLCLSMHACVCGVIHACLCMSVCKFILLCLLYMCYVRRCSYSNSPTHALGERKRRNAHLQSSKCADSSRLFVATPGKVGQYHQR